MTFWLAGIMFTVFYMDEDEPKGWAGIVSVLILIVFWPGILGTHFHNRAIRASKEPSDG